jgi:glycosyltransferase involved in cell wall biosynthesis
VARARISVIVPTGNREDVIEDCLKSVRWADELIVVDSFSTDGSLQIARKYADRILQHEYGFSVKQKNWAIPKATSDWVLIVDTDERVTARLRAEIETVLAAPTEHNAFRIPRENVVLGRTVRGAGYYPDYQVRLFRRDKARYELRRVHGHMVVDGSVGTLGAPIIHYTHRSLDQTVGNLLLMMTTWEAEERSLRVARNGQAFSSTRIALALALRPAAAFLSRFFAQGGWREGLHGLGLSMIWAMYVALTYMKIWERQLGLGKRWWTKDWRERRRHRSPIDSW